MQLVAGRDFDLKNFPSDSFGVILNESAVKAMGFKNPIGQIVKEDTNYHVVGVIKISFYDLHICQRSPW